MTDPSMISCLEIDGPDFSAGQAGNLLAAMVERQNAMAALAQGQAATSTGASQANSYNQMLSQMNGNMNAMGRASLSSMMSQHSMQQQMEALRQCQPGAMPDMGPSTLPGYSRKAPTASKADVPTMHSNKSQYQQMGKPAGTGGMPSGAWPGNMMPSQANETVTSRGNIPPGMYGNMPPSTTMSRGAVGNYPAYY